MGTITIKHIELIGEGDAFFPLAGDGDICVVLDRTGNTIIDVPRKMCVRGRVGGVLSLAGDGDVSLCGNLTTYRLDTELLSGVFDTAEGVIVMRPVHFEMGYTSKRFVAAFQNSTATTSTGGVIQDVRAYTHK